MFYSVSDDRRRSIIYWCSLTDRKHLHQAMVGTLKPFLDKVLHAHHIYCVGLYISSRTYCHCDHKQTGSVRMCCSVTFTVTYLYFLRILDIDQACCCYSKVKRMQTFIYNKIGILRNTVTHKTFRRLVISLCDRGADATAKVEE